MFIMSKYEASIWPRMIAPLLAGLLFTAAYKASAQAETSVNPTYIISDQDGYGLLECLTQKSACGQIVADSWCEAHGHGAAKAFGRADDLTASIDTKSPPHLSAKPDAAVVACAE
jgi:hypothetical protein